MHGPREGPGPSGGLPRWPAGGSPKCHTVVQRSHFGGHFWYPFLVRTCTQFYKKLQNGGPKSCQNRPSWAGAWGAWVLAVFIESLQDQPLIKQSPKLPKHPPRRAGFDHFWRPHFGQFRRTLCKKGEKEPTKMVSKMEPVCNSLALSGPPAIHGIATLHGP